MPHCGIAIYLVDINGSCVCAYIRPSIRLRPTIPVRLSTSDRQIAHAQNMCTFGGFITPALLLHILS